MYQTARMKLLKKVIAITAVVAILIVGVLVAIPLIYKTEIVRLVQADLNENLNATISFDEDVSVKILTSFPDLTVSVKNLTIIGTEVFQTDTLVNSGKIKVTIGLKELFNNHQISLKYAELIDTDISLLAKDNQYNWDIAKPTTSDSSNTAFSADFKKIKLQNCSFTYLDSNSTVEVGVDGITGSLTGEYATDSFDLVSLFTSEDTYISYDNVAYLSHLPLFVEATTAVNFATETYNFKKNAFTLGDIELVGNGIMKFIGDNISLNINYNSNKTDFQQLLGLVPNYYKEDLKEIQASGKASIEGTLNGLITETDIPGYTFKMKLEDGSLIHKQIPKPISKVNIDLAVENKDGKDENLQIKVSDFSFVYEDNPFSGNLFTSNIFDNPFVDARAKGKLNLTDLSTLIPREMGMDVSGTMNCDIAITGSESSLVNEEYNKLKTSGLLEVDNLTYTDKTLPNPINISKGRMNFTESEVKIPVLSLTAGKSDIAANGSVKNLIGYLISNQTLLGNITVSSSILNSSDFVYPSENSNESEVSDPIELPENMDVKLVYTIDQLNYDNHSFTHLSGSGKLADKALDLTQLSTDCLDGRLMLSGKFNTIDITKPFADINLTAQNINIQKAFKSFETIRLLAPIAENIVGKLSSTISIKTVLQEDFSPNLSSITCQGVLDLFDFDLKGLKAFNQIGNKLDLASFSRDISIKDLLMSFSIKDGKIEVNPFTLPIGESTLNLVGYSKLDQSINFDGLLSIPKQLYEKKKGSLNTYIPTNKLGELKNIEWSDVEFDVSIIGTYKKPQLKIDYHSTQNRIVDNVKSRIQSEADKKKEELRIAAKNELDKAKMQADAAKKAAEDEAKKALEEQKKKLEEQLKKEKEAGNKAVEDALKKKRDELLKGKIPPIKR